MFITKAKLREAFSLLFEKTEVTHQHPNKITRERLSETDHHAIKSGMQAYARSAVSYNNQAHGRGEPPSEHATQDHDIKRIARMESAIKRNPHIGFDHPVELHHGMRRAPEFDKHGHTTISGITSTTTNKNKVLTHIARAKTGNKEQEEDYIKSHDTLHSLKIKWDPAKHRHIPAVYVGHMSPRPGEEEALLPAGVRYKKVGEDMQEIDTKHGKRIHHVHEVEPVDIPPPRARLERAAAEAAAKKVERDRKKPQKRKSLVSKNKEE